MFKKSTPAAKHAAEPFRVPSLAEVDPAYADLVARRAALVDEQGRLSDEKKRLTAEVAATPAPPRRVRRDVAALLGDAVDDGPAANRARLAEVKRELEVHADAIEEIRRRIDEARGRASMTACAVVKPEYAARVRKLCEAMQALDEAQREFNDLRFALEAEDISWTRLGVMTPTFLGETSDPSRRVAQYLREAAEAGYWEAGR